MAEIFSKTNMFSSCPYTENRISQFHESSSGFKSVKLNSWCLSKKLVVQENAFGVSRKVSGHDHFVVKAQMKLGYMKAQRWWEKGLQQNMREVNSAQDLVDSLWRAGDSLVVVDFFSPGCGGCKALHPKVCQMAEMNPQVQFLHVNYEEHKSMCYSLNVHVLPFFRFYRGAHGRLCSFSCTNATIHKFKAALAKHTPDRCSLSPTIGLEEKELLQLAGNMDLSFQYTSKSVPTRPVFKHEEIAEKASCALPESGVLVPSSLCPSKTAKEFKDRSLVSSQR